LFRLDGLSGFTLFQPLRLAPFHRAVMGVHLFVILGARATEEEENLLRVGTAHAASFRSWRVVVKRSTLPEEEFLGGLYG